MSNETIEQFENLETLDGELLGKAGQFETLVERLALAIRDAYSGGAEHSTESDMRRARKDAKTVLAELASIGGKFRPLACIAQDGNGWGPMTYNVWLDIPSEHCRVYGGMTLAEAETMADQINSRCVSPILAAQAATMAEQAEEIERLRKRERAVAAWLEYEGGRAAVLLDDPESVERQIGAARNRAVKQLRARLNEASMPDEALSMNIMSADD